MLKLDNDLLAELGLGALPEEQKQGMLQHIYDTLELRVGTRLANQMTDQQLDEFERFIDVNGDANQAQALQWLEANLPHYKDVVNQVFEELKTEIKQMAPQIMVSSMPQGSVVAADPVTAAPQANQPQMVAGAQQDPQYTATQSGQAATAQPNPASQPPAQAYQDASAQVYQFPTQQPPAGPGSTQYRQAA